ncbi:MAG: SDR family NAD(P)-dependent oxidoreductase, partial [Pseudomonadota bacterium]|nr:SDR family NAD(P)-dependent oxidoreductase [Pseudomonadota bacterium]
MENKIMDNSNKLLQGKVALVTGAGHGMGRNHVMMLASRGATVIALDLDREAVAKTAKAIGGECLAVAADVTDIPTLQAAIAEAAM